MSQHNSYILHQYYTNKLGVNSRNSATLLGGLLSGRPSLHQEVRVIEVILQDINPRLEEERTAVIFANFASLTWGGFNGVTCWSLG
jgi:hypothetical protein